MIKFIKKNKILFLILVAGFLLRIYHPLTLFQYSHDQDLAGWFVRDVLISHHFRLIGQETSSHGIFIGPYFYYLQIPFYVLTRMDPAGAVLLPIIFGVFSIFSVYFVLTKIFEKRVGLIGALVYSLSSLIVFTDREVAPTTIVMLWSIWFLFSLWRILKGEKYGYIILGLLIGLIWSINLQLIIVLPLVVLAQIFSRKKINFKELLIGVSIALVLNIPFVAFELRHGFQQIRALISSLTTSKDYIAGTSNGFFAKLDRVMQLTYKNSTDIFWDSVLRIPFQFSFWVLNIVLYVFLRRKKIDLRLGIILFLWQIIYILFFSKISLNLSEYYLNGVNIVYIVVFALGVNFIMQNKDRNWRNLGKIILVVFAALNLYSFFTKPVNADGYVERKAVISYIKEDADKHGFPCVSMSYITSPGNDLGYRYFIWRLRLKTKPISNNVPVYSVVFPLSKVDSFDKSFGALGLVLPDYKRYNVKTIQKACEGDDFTTSQPMFGFTN